MKKLLAVLMLLSLVGCAGFGVWSTGAKTEGVKIETALENIDWNNLLVYWQDFVKGLNFLLPVIETAFPGTTKADTVIGSVAAKANTAVTDLTTAVAAVNAGTITQAQAVSIAADVKNQVMAADTVIGLAYGAAKPKATTPVPTASATSATLKKQ